MNMAPLSRLIEGGNWLWIQGNEIQDILFGKIILKKELLPKIYDLSRFQIFFPTTEVLALVATIAA